MPDVVSPAGSSSSGIYPRRRTRASRREGYNRCATTGDGTRRGNDNDGGGKKPEETSVRAEVASNDRFAVLGPKEPAPGIEEEERESTLPVDPRVRYERPMTIRLQIDTLPTDRPSSSGAIKDICQAPTPPVKSCAKRPSILRLMPYTSAKSTRVGPNQQTLGPAAASISPSKPQAQPSPLVLHANALSVGSSEPSSTSVRYSTDSDIKPPYLSLKGPQSPPKLPTPPIPDDPLPSPDLGTLPPAPTPPNPMSPDPLSSPGLATVPVHPSLDFKSFTSAPALKPGPVQFEPPVPTDIGIFPEGDPMRDIVKTVSGKIFHMAAEIAATNAKSKMNLIGNVLIPGPAKRFGKVKGKIDRKDLGRGSRKCAYLVEYVEDESDEEEGEEGGEGEGWVGKDEGFWKQPFEEGYFVRRGPQTRKRRGL